MMTTPLATNEVVLDPELRSPEVLEFERKLRDKIVGQDRAVRRMVNMYQLYMAGMSMPGRPIGNLLFLGPTGSGKTRVVESAAEVLFGSPRAVVKIDCAEFQHSHEIAKLIGSPPGYLGHRETPPLLTQEAIDQHQTEKNRFTFLLFDEIEKANEALWQLLLGILDKATLTLGDNRRVDMSRTIVCMTSNLGAAEMSTMVSGGLGFTSSSPKGTADVDELDRKIYRTALDAARRKFSPEFMNRIDKVVVFRTLNEEHLRQILEIELREVQARIISSQPERPFTLALSAATKEFLLREGTDLKYGARHLKRAIERYLVFPLSNLIATGQIELGDQVKVDIAEGAERFAFRKEAANQLRRSMNSAAEHGSRKAAHARVSPVDKEFELVRR